MSCVAEPLQQRFDRFVDKSQGLGPLGECWLWTGPVRPDSGYGWLGKCQADGGGYLYAHRHAYQLAMGAIPAGLVVRHRCDVRHCVNPSHMELGTRTDNAHDRDSRGRTAKGALVGSAKLTEEHVLWIRALGTFGWGPSRLGRLFHVNPTSVHDILKRKNWKHI